jgi:hypothetical protein
MQVIPLTSEPASSFEIQIEGVIYRLVIRRNSRQGVWIGSFYTTENIPVAVGIPLVLGVPLLDHHALPIRYVYMYSADAQALSDAGANDLGGRVIMIKLNQAEHDELFPPAVAAVIQTAFLNGDSVQFVNLDYVEIS